MFLSRNFINQKSFSLKKKKKKTDGEAYCLGSEDGECWYLYTLNREKTSAQISGNGGLLVEREPDQTIEIMMTHLDPEVMSIFTRDVCSTAAEATRKSGIDQLIPTMLIDDFLFEPCGYSMNGVSKSVSLCYFNVLCLIKNSQNTIN